MSEHDKLAEAREALRGAFPEPWILRLRANSASNPDAWCAEVKIIGPAARQVVAVEAWGESPAVAAAELMLAWRRASVAALAAARAEGAQEAFERAAAECERVAAEARKNDREWRDWQWALGRERGAAPKDGTTHYAAIFAAAIRALAEKERGA